MKNSMKNQSLNSMKNNAQPNLQSVSEMNMQDSVEPNSQFSSSVGAKGMADKNAYAKKQMQNNELN